MKIKLGKLAGAIGKIGLKILSGGKVQLDERDRVDINSGIDIIDAVVESEANKIIDKRVAKRDEKGRFSKS